MAEENVQKVEGNVVIDKGQSKLSDLWLKEDYWAIWLGFILLVVGVVIFLPRQPEGMHAKIEKSNSIMQAEVERGSPFKTVAFLEAQDAKEKIKARNQGFAKKIKSYMAKPSGWKNNPLDSFVLSKDKADAINAANMPKYEAAKEKADLAKALAL